MFPCHVLEPREAQIWRVLVAFSNPEIIKKKFLNFNFILVSPSLMPPRGILVPVHEINEHLGVLLVFLHLHGVSKNHVQIEHKILDLQLQKAVR